MKPVFLTYLLFLILSINCKQSPASSDNHKISAIQSPEPLGVNPFIDPAGTTIKTRFLLPTGFSRIGVLEESYENYLRNLPLHLVETTVKLYNGQLKSNQDIHEAVVDLEIGNRDLHQCADAIIRLRAEYLWKRQKYKQIHFNFTNGFKVDYTEWMKGRKMIVEGNKTYWDQTHNPSNTYEDFWNYMELIFMYAGTLSLSKELVPVDINKMKIGDVFIQGGSPGHAVVVVDLAINRSGQKIYLLAQSYMPAQELHVLKNLNDVGPWYDLTEEETIYTPEWSFSKNDLKRF